MLHEYQVSNRNLPKWFAIAIPAAILAFWKTYFGILASLPETITSLVHAHFGVMAIWLMMLIAQAWFINTARYRAHRWVGRSSFVVVPVSILLTIGVMHEVFNRTPDGVPHEIARLNILGFGQTFAFALTWVLAIVYRRKPEIHVRFIISTILAMSTAIFFRIFFHWIPGFDSLAASVAGNATVLALIGLILIALDWRKGIRRSPYWVVTITLGIMSVGYWTYARTDSYYAFCQWFADLPLRGA